jgi:hypothetical protein
MKAGTSLPSSQTVAPLTAFGVALAVVILCAVLPFGVWRANTARVNAEGRAQRVLDAIAAKQDEARAKVIAMQKDLADLRVRVLQLAATTDQDAQAIATREASDKGDIDRVNAEFAAADTDLTVKLAALEDEAKANFKDLRSQLDIRKNRFLVKWHGDEGVKTSKRMATEMEALNFFNEVGEFAKKMLMYDGQKWVLLREYGGENWLTMMRDDGEAQDGDGKVTNKPSGARRSDPDA